MKSKIWKIWRCLRGLTARWMSIQQTNTPSQEDQDLLYDLYGVNEESEQSVLSTDSCEEIGTEAEVQEDVDDQLLLFP